MIHCHKGKQNLLFKSRQEDDMGKRLIKAVGALDEKEVEQIKICDSTKRTIEVVELVGFGKLPSDSPWKDDQKAMEIITNEITSGPFNFVVLFSLDE